MILKSCRIIPNWILDEAFKSYYRNQDDEEARKEIDSALCEAEDVKVDRSNISEEDLEEVVDKFEEIIEEFWDLMDDFFEKHGLGDDGWGGGNDDDNDDKNDDDEDDSGDNSKELINDKESTI